MRLLTHAARFGDRVAIVDSSGAYTYHNLLDASRACATVLLQRENAAAPSTELQEQRVAFLVPPGFFHVAAQWGIWRAGGVAVPLALSHPPAEWEYVLDDVQPTAIIAAPGEHADRLRPLAQARSLRWLTLDERLAMGDGVLPAPALAPSRRAMILYTSGTTSKPKGVTTTHGNIQSQVETLVRAWRWAPGDRILHVLPLHHVHGIINVLTCALWSGACCEFQSPFDAEAVWRRIAGGGLTLFMAVPTIYARLIAAWERASAADQQAFSRAAGEMRLMVSGSAALPVSTLERWREITGQVLLERYGMTEIGMALSNPYDGPRIAGHVGQPLPGVEVRRVDEQGKVLEDDSTPGEIQVRGDGVFSEYWRRPTADSFQDGWFKTGDIAVIEDGSYRILGRNSVDIIKTGGYKVSALEIEETLRDHEAVAECAVVGVADDEWGQRVAACIVPAAGHTITLQRLREWAKQKLAPYKVPTRLLVVAELPRNAMGKVQKPQVAKLFESKTHG